MNDKQSIRAWVAELKASYPYLPDHLSIEVEKDRLATLQPWFARIHRLRKLYDEMDRTELPDELREAGKRQVVPVLMGLEYMTDEEVKAWHELFVCLSAMMADLAFDYYKTHLQTKNASMTLIDVLNYLPVVFLYVLSSYDPTRGGDHDNDFSKEDGRVRLITWVWRDARRHINSYLQQHAYTVKRGSGAVHRLKSKLLQAQQALADRLQRDPRPEEVVEYVNDEMGLEVDLDAEMYNIIIYDDTLSLHNPATDDASVSFEDLLMAEPGEVESAYDPTSFAMRMARGNLQLQHALRRLFDTNEPLSTLERFTLGV